jgi:hypothetical protein
MTRTKESAAEKRAARQFGEFARSVRRNLRQVRRIRQILQQAEEAARRCHEKAGLAMLDAKASSSMSEEAFTAWLASFGLSQEDLAKCLELGQLALDRRKAGSADREEALRNIVKETRQQISPESIHPGEERWARPREKSEQGQHELRR